MFTKFVRYSVAKLNHRKFHSKYISDDFPKIYNYYVGGAVIGSIFGGARKFNEVSHRTTNKRDIYIETVNSTLTGLLHGLCSFVIYPALGLGYIYNKIYNEINDEHNKK